MKNILKSIAALSCIAVVCTALLVVGALYLPKQIRTFDWGDYLNDPTAVFAEMPLSDVQEKVGYIKDNATGAEISAVYQATGGAAKGGYVLKSVASSNYGKLEMIVGISKAGKVVKVGYSQLLSNNGFYTTPLVQENYDKFVGKNPLEMTPDDLVSTSKATITKEVMLNAIQLSYRVGSALTGSAVQEESEEVKLAKKYFTQKVEDAKLAADVPADVADHVSIYEVTLEGGVEAWVFVDTKVYHRFEVTLPDNDGVSPDDIVSDDANGSFYLTETAVGVYRDGDGFKYGKLTSKGTTGSVSYIGANSTLLAGKPFGEVTVAQFAQLIAAGSGATDLGAADFSGATASGLNFLKNLNNMVGYIEPYLAAGGSGTENGGQNTEGGVV